MRRWDPDAELPVKLGPCSNSEFRPVPLGTVEQEAIRRTRAEAERHARRLGMARREFLRTLGGAALMLGVLSACHDDAQKVNGERAGGRYRIHRDAASEPDAARGSIAGDEVIVDVQTHYLNYDPAAPGGISGISGLVSSFPQNACGEADARACFSVDHYLDLLFGQSDTNMTVLSAIPLPEQSNPLTIEDMELARRLAERLCGDERVLMHGGVQPTVGPPGLQIDGADIGPAARAHPGVRFVVYHSGYEATGTEGPYTAATARQGVNRLVTSLRDAGIGPGGNVYAELGSTWWALVRDPTQAAHVLGKLLVAVGPDRILWGTDSLWYGSPQDQIQAFRSFEIAPELQETHGYPALTDEVKRKILGRNAMALYGIDAVPDRCTFSRDDLAELRAAAPAAWRTYGPETDAELAHLLATHGMT